LPQTCASGAFITLDASASYDLDGDPLAFEWQEVLDSYDDCPVLGTGPVLSIWLPPGLHSIRLLASDGEATQRTYTGVGVVPYVGHFSDVPGPNDEAGTVYWAFWQVEACVQNNVVTGYEDGTYQPETKVTRDQMAVFIARTLVTPMGEGGLAGYLPPTTPSFSDVPADFWSYRHIEYLKAHTVVSGYSDGTYRPAVKVTRDQMAVFIARGMAAKYGGEEFESYLPPVEPTFPDVPVEQWARKHIEYLRDQGVVQGYTDGTYRPTTVVTRGQMAVFVARAFDLLP
jgi:hypothetical protein